MPPRRRPDVDGKVAATVERADVVRNRERIFAAARQLFAERGRNDVSFDDIAEVAGVGRATLFRHLGSKDALVTAIYAARLEDIHGLAREALGAVDAWTGFETMLRTLMRWMHEDRGLYDFAQRLNLAQRELLPERGAEVTDEIGLVIARAQAAGSLWTGLRALDVVPLLAFAGTQDSDRLEDYLQVLIRGLRIDTSD